MGAPRKRERVRVNLRLVREHVDFFKGKNIKINTWVVEQMEKFVKNQKNGLK